MPSQPVEVDQVHVGQLAGVVDRPPRPRDRVEVGRDQAVLDRLRERLAEEGREQLVLLPGRLDLPLAATAPVGVGLRVGADAREKGLACRRPARWNITDAAIIASTGRLDRRRARAVGDIGVAGRVDHAAGQDRLAPGLRFRDDADDRLAVHDRGDEQAVEHRPDAGLLHQPVGHELEPLGVELVRQRLALRHRRPHRLAPAPRTRGRCRRPRPSARAGTRRSPRRRRP